MLEALRSAVRWKLHSFAHDQLVHTHPLRYLFLELTRRCNLACSYCGSSCGPRQPPGELTVDEWIGIVRQLGRDFAPRSVMVSVMGGEPLVVPGVTRLFRALGDVGFPFGMVSNATLLDAPMAAELVESGMSSISLSLDAPPPVSDMLRGPGVAAKVEAAVGHLRDAGYRGLLEIMSVATRKTIPLLPAMQRHLAGLGIRHWRVVPVMPIGRAAGRPELELSPADLRAMYSYIKQARAEGVSPPPQASCECYLGDEYEGQVRDTLFRCQAGLTVGSVLADGGIAACPELSRSFVQGDIRTERFKDVWETRYRSLRDRSWAYQGDCRGCATWDRCRGGSMHLYSHPGADLMRCSAREMAGALPV